LQARILGIDPGSQVTGYGIVESRDGRIVHVAHGTVRASRERSTERRLADLYRSLLEVIDHHKPELGSVEQLFVARGARAALVLGQARGVALAALGSAGIAVHEYAPSRIKQSVTGNGRASKLQVQRVVKRLLDLQRAPATDAADALAAALCHAQAGRLERLGVRTRVRRRTAARGPVVQVRRAR
jgi:crossover junction endodeoxyribonuclease RuvC